MEGYQGRTDAKEGKIARTEGCQGRKDNREGRIPRKEW
jgi:hypothetical protein